MSDRVFILIHHIGGDGKTEVCGIYSSEEDAEKYCLDDSWGYYSLQLNRDPLLPDVVFPTIYTYPKREDHKKWLYTLEGWSKVKEEEKGDY